MGNIFSVGNIFRKSKVNVPEKVYRREKKENNRKQNGDFFFDMYLYYIYMYTPRPKHLTT